MNVHRCLFVASVISLYSCTTGITSQEQSIPEAVSYMDIFRDAKAIETQYTKSNSRPIVKIAGGSIIFGGEFSTIEERQLAYDALQSIPGVSGVSNFAEVRPESASSKVEEDRVINDRAKKKIQWLNINIDPFTINGTVYLLGWVTPENSVVIGNEFSTFPSDVKGVKDVVQRFVLIAGGYSPTSPETGGWGVSAQDTTSSASSSYSESSSEPSDSLMASSSYKDSSPTSSEVGDWGVSAPDTTSSTSSSYSESSSEPSDSSFASSSHEDSSATMNMIGALAGAVLGGSVVHETGNVAQGRQVMEATWNAFGFDTSGATASTGSSGSSGSNGSSGSSGSIGSVEPSLASASATGDQAQSGMLKTVEGKRYNFSSGKCPVDIRGVKSDVSYPEILKDDVSFSQTIIDMAQKAGGYDVAIALSEAQRVEYMRAALEAEAQARDSWGGIGEIYDKSQCPDSEGIYCSGVHGMWINGDATIITQYSIDALKCHMAAGTPL